MNALAARRRHPAAIVILLLFGLVAVGGIYSLLAPKTAQAAVVTADDAAQGRKLFLANCASCHGAHAEGTSKTGPSLAGVGAGAVHFQMETGRMPLSGPAVQAVRTKEIKYTQGQIDQIAAYVATLGPGPGMPDKEYTEGTNANIAKGGELFRVNCAMCHNFAGSGGALTLGKFAPALRDIEGTQIYLAMETGPQSMPVFNDTNLTPEDKNNIIGFLHNIDKDENPGGMNLGNLGPVSEGLFAWIFGLGLLIGVCVWLGSKAA